MKTLRSEIIIVLFSLLLLFGSCKEDTVSPQSDSDNLDMSVLSTPDFTDNSGTLVLDTVKVLIKDIKLNVAGGSDSTNFKVGPYVFYLNLNSSINTLTSALIPAGTYDKVKFEIHKLENNEVPPDPDFLDANGRYSVVVKGSFNGVPFIFKSDKSAHQKLNFPNSLIITAGGRSNITIKVSPYMWFYENNSFLDPNDPANRNNIENNIKDNINNNFKAFKDNNKDGIPDN
ncbi:MAG: hypothetical protein M3R36_00680 [Bacteroidota bacterium]|nr:hypothetical protein [Bacteroidota bacterium]